MNEHTEMKYLYQHISPETAYIVEDYPWGFRLRTTIRYWIETKHGKNGGQRFGRQTINPKTGKWCAPKYSTYSPIIIMYLDEKSHVQLTRISHNTEEAIIRVFKATHLSNLNEYQKEMLREIFAYQEVMKHVKFEVKVYNGSPVSLLSQHPDDIAKREAIIKEQEENKIEKEKAMRKINHAISCEYQKNRECIN